MSKVPFISIVLPTRDRPELVEQCLMCLKQQDFLDFEVIVSDNPVTRPCEAVVAPFLADSRFRYYQVEQALAMTDNWEFAISFATGDYVAVISEKFMFRPDALSTLHRLAATKLPDILTWQYDHFELCDHQRVLGTYHPLLKPVAPEYYSAADELKRRLDFVEPLFSRNMQQKNGRGKIYSGCVKRQIVKKVRDTFGRIFKPLSPDFTSMICFLSQSELCLDVGQSLMLLVDGQGISNGGKTKTSVEAIVSYLSDCHSSFKEYCDNVVIPGFGIGHSVAIATDYDQILDASKSGHLKYLKLNKAAVLGWAQLEIEHVEDWAGYKKSDFLAVLDSFKSQLSLAELAVVEQINEVNLLHRRPSPNEIYHSGLKKVDYFIDGIRPEELAALHWQEHIALPRRNVGNADLTVAEAISYFYLYNQATNQMLGFNE